MALIPPSLRQYFRKGFSTKSMRRGSGLGLSICKELVERLGGRIAATQDEEFGGANFSIWLPRLTAALTLTHNGMRDLVNQCVQ